MERCYNQGCGQEYDPENNQEDSCRHHPGAPFFHDAYKGWSCCNKKTVDFTEFLGIKGCTLSRHSNVKPLKEEPPASRAVETEPVVKVCPPPKPVAMERPSFDTEMVPVTATVAPALKDAIDNLLSSKPEEQEAEKSETVAIGTICKNSGCNYNYTGTEKDRGECQHHDGLPIFHEGLKFWSCCNRRTTDFGVFMAQPGCTYGQHVWIQKKDVDRSFVQCRYDWHQTAKDVIVSIYAKKYHYAHSKIKVSPIRLQVSLVFPEQNGAVFKLDIELEGIVKAAEASSHMFGSKVEITMPKAEPGHWPKLECVRKPVKKASSEKNNKPKQNFCEEKCYEEISLDDVEVTTGVQLSELARTKPHHDDDIDQDADYY